MKCSVCRSTKGKEHTFREMMFGTRSEFSYWECCQCGFLQIVTVPTTLADHYSNSYYSFSLHFASWKRLYYRLHFNAPKVMKWLRRCTPDISSVIASKPPKNARILDVGCGGGRLVGILRALGFDAHGIDPFLSSETKYLRKASLEDVSGEWDLIMFHHSLEHMQNHVEILRLARSKLSSGGTCLVRIPIAAWAWEHYGENWVQLDAPRHLAIHSLRSFRMIAETAGFQIAQIVFDSDEFSFWGSELYKHDLPLHDEKAKGLVSRKERAKFREMANALNAEQRGDQAAFFLKAN